jgi:hypothetical protein
LQQSHSSDLPPARIREYQSEDAPASVSGFIQERSSICLGKLARKEQTETRSTSSSEKWLEDPFRVLGLYAGSAVHDLQVGASGGSQSSVTDLDDRLGTIRCPVLECVFTQIPDNLAQL